MHIQFYSPALQESFDTLFVAYFLEDLQVAATEAGIRSKLCPFIHNLWEKQIIRIDLLILETEPIGFSIYQIDTPESDWCKKEGWGFIREFYIHPDFRHLGYGTLLANHTVAMLSQMGSAQIYLTADDAREFWLRCGFHQTEEICSNDLPVFVK